MSHFKHLDELVREYLLFRGFTITLKSYDGELKVDKDRGFRVDRIVDQFLHFINNHDLNSLRELWTHFDQKIFSKLEHDHTTGVKKLESSLLKLYLINAIVSKNHDKVTDFFIKMTPELQGQPEWKDWFMLPYIKNPEDHNVFAVHFTKQWQDTFLVSLHNFLAIIYQVMPQPALSSYEEEATKLRRLQEENETLKHKLTTLSQCSNVVPEAVPPMDIMDDFYIIAQENSSLSETSKSFKSLIRTIGGGLPTSPIMGRKQSQDEHIGVQKFSKRHVSQGGYSKSINAETAPKRSLSLDSKTRRGKEINIENAERKESKKDFLLLSQEKMTDHKSSVTQCKFNSVGNTVASCDNDGTIKIWSPGPNTVKIHSSMSFKSALTSLDWLTKNERYVVSGSIDGILRLHDIKESKTIWEAGNDESSPLFNTRILTLACSTTDCMVACSCVNNYDKLAKLLLFDQSFSLGSSGNNLTANCCRFNHNGSLLLVGCSDGTVKTLDLRNGECVESWDAHNGNVWSLQVNTDHTLCYTLGADHKLCRYDLAHNSESNLRIALPECQSVHGTQSFSLHSNGNHILTACGYQGANIYQLRDNHLRAMLNLGGHRNPLVACDWTTANQCATCISTSVDGRIKISTLLTP